MWDQQYICYINTSVNNKYDDIILEEAGMTTCNPAPSPGVAHMKSTVEDEAPLDHEQDKRHRRLVGKIQWLAHTRTTRHQLSGKGTSKITTITNTV